MTDDDIARLRASLLDLDRLVRAEGFPRHILSKIDDVVRMIDLVIRPDLKREP